MGRARQLLTLLSGGGVITYDNYVASLSPLVYFRHNESSGSPLNYGSASGLTITASNLAYQRDGLTGTGQAQEWFSESANSRLYINNDARLNAMADQTWAFLLRRDGIGKNNYAPLMCWGNGPAAGDNHLFITWNNNAAVMQSVVKCATTPATTITSVGLTEGAWIWLVMTYSHTGDRKIRLYTASGGGVTELATSTQTASVGDISAMGQVLNIGTRNDTFFIMDGLIDESLVFNRVLSQAEIATLSSFFFFNVGVTVASPVAGEMIQRDGITGDIAISGTIGGPGVFAIEARFNGGDWTTIATGQSGTYSGSLENQPMGQGTLEVRAIGSNQAASVVNVGIGDVYLIIGDSNAAGQITTNQSWTHATLSARMLAKDYQWRTLADPTHTDAGVIDEVMDDPYTMLGSVWPLLATLILDDDVPVAFVPAAIAGTTAQGTDLATSWQPGEDHQDRTTLYGAAVYRALQVQGGVRAVICWLGTNDIGASVEQSAFNIALDTIVNALATDLGVQTCWPKLQSCTGKDDAHEAIVEAAIAEAWADNANIITGVDFGDIETDDNVHIKDPAKGQTVASRILAALYP